MAGHKKYSRDFKLQALALVESSGKSISELEQELGITVGSLHKWKARHTRDGGTSLSGQWAAERGA